VDFATCTDQAGEAFDALIRHRDGVTEFLELDFIDALMKLRGCDLAAFELVWDTVELLLERAPEPEGLSA
jgi:hypothetical protein